jgi:hypothetical protein
MLLKIEEIEEFELVRRIPRAAITKSILEGVRRLDERTELEPFIRSILPDVTETPHGPTEMVDIFTPHLTHNGKAQLAVFINKGKGFPRVTSEHVARQILKARRIPAVNLFVLLTVGNIYDDARTDLIMVANDAQANFMFVDAQDVARLLIIYRKICPEDGNPYIDGKCRKCGGGGSTY